MPDTGFVMLRQQLETANGTVRILLEDETWVTQAIFWKSQRDAQGKKLLRPR